MDEVNGPENEDDVGIHFADPDTGRRYTFWMPADMYDQLNEQAKKRQRSVAWIVREIIGIALGHAEG